MATFRVFAQNMARTADTINRNATIILRRTALAADQAVVIGTPVDTGRARSNWLTNIGSAREDTVETLGPSALAASIAAAASVIGRAKQGDAIHITNNLPYIQPLNEGHSQQASAGYIQRAIQAAANAVQQLSILGRLS